MVMKYYVYPYKTGSRSARALAMALNGKVLRREGSTFVPRADRKVLNWGNSTCPYSHVLNRAADVACMGNKLTAFQKLAQPVPGLELPQVPRWTQARHEASEWLSAGHKVVSRTVLNGHSGQGIIVTSPNESALGNAPLYVKYIKKDAEYRVHIFNGEVIDVQRKIKDPEREVTDWGVRSHQNGFMYVRNDRNGVPVRDTIPLDIIEQSRRAMGVSGLVFGGVDAVWNARRGRAYILEINTAPGMDGSTPQIYANAIRKYYEEVT